MADIFSKKRRSEIMAKIKGSGTLLENRGWQILKKTGVKFRKHPKGIIGNPDAAIKSKKAAIFFDSEFWHGFDWEEAKKEIKSNKKFWHNKIEKNIMRDKIVNNLLRNEGWKVIRIWEKELNEKNSEKTLKRLIRTLGIKKN